MKRNYNGSHIDSDRDHLVRPDDKSSRRADITALARRVNTTVNTSPSKDGFYPVYSPREE